MHFLVQWAYNRWGKPVRVAEYNPADRIRARFENRDLSEFTPDRITTIYEQDPLFVLLVEIPFKLSIYLLVGGIIGILVSLPLFFVGVLWAVSLLSLGALSVLIGWIFLRLPIYLMENYFPVIPETVLAVRQFIGTTYFRKGRMFSFPRWGWTWTVLFPGDVDLLRTADKPGQPDSVVCFVLRNYLDKEKGDEQFFAIQVSFNLMVRTAPSLVIDNFYKEFIREGIEAIDMGTEWVESINNACNRVIGIVRKQMLKIVQGHADEVLCMHSLPWLLFDRVEANKAATNHYWGVFQEYGIEVLRVSIVDIKDLKPDGMIAQLTSATRAEAHADAQKRKAEADRQQRVANANANEAATVREQETLRTIADERRQTLEKQTTTEMQAALLEFQSTLANMDGMKGRELEYLLAQFGLLDKAHQSEILNQIANSMRMAHTNVIAGVTGSPGEANPMVALIFEALRRFSPGGSATGSLPPATGPGATPGP